MPTDLLNPRHVWAGKGAYDATARNLADRFQRNFEQSRGYVSAEVAGVL